MPARTNLDLDTLRTLVVAHDLGGLAQAAEHYGQLVVYYRLEGLVPPESRPKK